MLLETAGGETGEVLEPVGFVEGCGEGGDCWTAHGVVGPRDHVFEGGCGASHVGELMGRGGGVGWFFTDGAQYGVRGWVGWDLIVEAHGGGVRGANGDFRAFGSRGSGAGWVEAPKFVGGLFGAF